jgi:hypothetical protein
MNIADVSVLDKNLVIVVTSGHCDGFKGCYWYVYDLEGGVVAGGQSKGWSGDGAGSALSAKKLAKAAARRFMKKCEEYGVPYIKRLQHIAWQAKHYAEKCADGSRLRNAVERDYKIKKTKLVAEKPGAPTVKYEIVKKRKL